ncbi:MAG TPA: hypothetical protein IAB84_11395 [Candidatus Choladousia intestinigallinarum]|nr:hypothetical protein [Candidatus Choladousia intestinigallinarum]
MERVKGIVYGTNETAGRKKRASAGNNIGILSIIYPPNAYDGMILLTVCSDSKKVIPFPFFLDLPKPRKYNNRNRLCKLSPQASTSLY